MIAEILMVRFLSGFVLRNQERENSGQEHEDQRLHEADQQLPKSKTESESARPSDGTMCDIASSMVSPA